MKVHCLKSRLIQSLYGLVARIMVMNKIIIKYNLPVNYTTSILRVYTVRSVTKLFRFLIEKKKKINGKTNTI